MKKKTSTLMITIVVIFVGLALIIMGLMRSNFDYFMTIDQLKASKPGSSAAMVRVLGQVSADSWKPAGSVGSYTFTLEDQKQTLAVQYTGSPINPASGKQIVVEGYLDDKGTFISRKIMTKCESKYSSSSRGER
jgi:cytochrome c-type biogenesis protein CcmE